MEQLVTEELEIMEFNKVKTYKDLIVWQKSMDLVTLVYSLTEKFPKEETYGLSSQMRRAVVSIPSNIAEGWGRYSKNNFIHFLKIARGSLYEIETQLIVAQNLKIIQEYHEIENLIEEISKMIFALINKLNSSSTNSSFTND